MLVGNTTLADESMWSVVSGPGNAVFTNASQASTSVIFDRPGNYVLRLSAGNPIGESFSNLLVNASDLTPPVISVPDDMVKEATSAAGTVVSFSTSALDAVSGPLPTSNIPASGSVFPLGTTTVTASAVDAAGNSTSRTFNVTVTAGSFSTWAGRNFTVAELANPSISGPDATPAGDGLTNLMKYALGLPPKTPSVTGIIFEKAAASWRFTYTRPAYRPDIVYAVEVTTDPTGATWTTSGVSHTLVSPGDPETWRAEVAPDPARALFLRLKVVQP